MHSLQKQNLNNIQQKKKIFDMQRRRTSLDLMDKQGRDLTLDSNEPFAEKISFVEVPHFVHHLHPSNQTEI